MATSECAYLITSSASARFDRRKCADCCVPFVSRPTRFSMDMSGARATGLAIMTPDLTQPINDRFGYLPCGAHACQEAHRPSEFDRVRSPTGFRSAKGPIERHSGG